jgi:hypothetical protein
MPVIFVEVAAEEGRFCYQILLQRQSLCAHMAPIYFSSNFEVVEASINPAVSFKGNMLLQLERAPW